ncbi:hypothetical protein K2173_021311 [Erythroxylum novogranatense]|uniref:LOB domain-containing protein n=1 Tax=Erythroxylum novogranatense TaxID=1862640 RepID=A0AAV8TXA9_9ROSI|nr:hypothetical protein K2173_021311 [Erythroxylum novogranatense]
MSSSSSPCAACKLLRRKCTQECVFAPYFPADQPQKFASVHKVFGASNVTKLLNELNFAEREDAVKSLAFEAETRLSDPIYGCVGIISILQHKLRQLHCDLDTARKELATYIGPQAMLPILHPPSFIPQQQLSNPPSTVVQHGRIPMMGIPTGGGGRGQLMLREPQHQQHQHQQHSHQQQQQIFEVQQLAAVREQQEMYRTYEQQQQQQNHHQTPQQQDFLRFNGAFEGTRQIAATGFNHITSAAMSPSLALSNFDNNPYHQVSPHAEHDLHHQLQAQLLLQTQQQPPKAQQQRSGSEEGV